MGCARSRRRLQTGPRNPSIRPDGKGGRTDPSRICRPVDVHSLRGEVLARVRSSVVIRRSILVVLVLVGLLAAAVGTAFGTSSTGVTAETARGPLVDRPLDVNMNFGNGTTKVKLSTKGPMEVAVQRSVAAPGATFGWHSHPGPTIVTDSSGTLSRYHAEHCTM